MGSSPGRAEKVECSEYMLYRTELCLRAAHRRKGHHKLQAGELISRPRQAPGLLGPQFPYKMRELVYIQCLPALIV